MRIANQCETALDGWLVVGVYNSAGEMIGVKNELLTNVRSTVEPQFVSVGLGDNSVDDVETVKVMLWDSASDFKPYHDAVEVMLTV